MIFILFVLKIVGLWQDFTAVTKWIKKFKSLYGFGGRWLTIRDICMDFELCFKFHWKHQTWSNDQSYSDLSCDGVKLLITENLKLAQFPAQLRNSQYTNHESPFNQSEALYVQRTG